MAASLVADLEFLADLSGELLASGLLRVEVVEAWLACHELAALGDLQTLGERFVCFHGKWVN